QISRVVYGAHDTHRGYTAMGGKLHPKTEVITGIMEAECSALMKDFFKRRR
ncbi:MAG: nucleoside deaminase, partial [Flavobacterium sp.]